MLKERVSQEMKEAMKARNTEKVSVLRMLWSDIKKKEIDSKTTLDDNGIIKAIQTMIKQRKESITAFEKGGREDLANKERAEIGFLEVYLPEQMSEAEVAQIVKSVAEELGATTIKDMGKVMKAAMAKVAGRADGKLINALVKKQLAS